MNTLNKMMTLILVGALPQLAVGQDLLPEDVKKEAVLPEKIDAPATGWKIGGTLGGTASFGHSSNVVGATDGSTVQLGLLLSLAADWTAGQHRWLTKLTLKETQTRTPAVDAFLKSTDDLELVSTYYYRLLNPNWMGFFGQLKLNTQIFDSVYRKADPIRVRMTSVNDDGVVTNNDLATAQTRVRLGDGFQPITLRESIGAFAQPYEGPKLDLVVKAGAGFQHTIVSDGNYAYAETIDISGVDWAVFKELRKNNEIGAELEAEAKGDVFPGALSWTLKLNLFHPLVVTEDIYDAKGEKMEGLELTNVDLSGGLSAKLNAWLSLEYAITVKRIPSVADVWQIQNGLVASASFNIL